MKKIYIFSIIITFFCLSSHAQWCTPAVGSNFMNSYGSNSPVITNVSLNTINRNSAASAKELYINTGLSTTLIKGQSYPFSMNFTMDPSICNIYVIRVWIDWNQNGVLNNTGETALTVNGLGVGTFGGNISVPGTAMTGTTRMRVAMKMDGCGHTPPDPCVPSEPVGWHGEIEDYTITVVNPTGINDIEKAGRLRVYPNPAEDELWAEINGSLYLRNIHFKVYDILGNEVLKQEVISGRNKFKIERGELQKGVYMYQLFSDHELVTNGKLILK
jgi:hypothetical protein